MQKISIIIPVRNRKECTQHILAQILEQISSHLADTDLSVIVVDDGSSDGTKAMILQQFPSIYLLEGDGSLWWTGAIAKGMEYAFYNLHADYMVWLNDDIFLSENFIQEILEICNSSSYQKSVIGGIVRAKNYLNWIVFSGNINKQPIRSMNDFQKNEEIEIDTLNGNITMIPRKVVETIGFPDRKRFRHYGGDYEFAIRAKNSGFQVILSSRLQATTDYQIEDLIRYMPPGLQWYLEPKLSQKIKILQGLTSLKTNYNIWHMVNIIHENSEYLKLWDYAIYYIRQVIKLLISDIFLSDKMEHDLKNYLLQQKTPTAIADAIISRKTPQ